MRIAISLEIAGGRTWIRTTDLFLIRQAEQPAHLDPRRPGPSPGTTITAAICSENERLVSQGVPTKAIADRGFGLQNDCRRDRRWGGAPRRSTRDCEEPWRASPRPGPHETLVPPFAVRQQSAHSRQFNMHRGHGAVRLGPSSYPLTNNEHCSKVVDVREGGTCDDEVAKSRKEAIGVIRDQSSGGIQAQLARSR